MATLQSEQGCVYVCVCGALFTNLQGLTRTQKSHQARMCPLVLPEASPPVPSFYPLLPRPAVSGVWLGWYRGPATLPQHTGEAGLTAGPRPLLLRLFHSWYCSGISHTHPLPRGALLYAHTAKMFEVIFLISRSFLVGSISGLIFGNYRLHPTLSLATPGWWVLLRVR